MWCHRVTSIQPIIPKISKWTNGAEIARKINLKLLNFQKTQNIQPKTMEMPGGKQKLDISKKFCIPCKVVLFSGNFGKSFPIYHWEFPEMQTRIFDQMESTSKQEV